MFAAPRRALADLVVVDLLAVSGSVWAASRFHPTPHSWGLLALLAVLALAFEEGSRRAARLQIRLMNSPTRADMTSVWTVAAAIALPPALAVLMVAVLTSYVWFRQQRPAGEVMFRKGYTAATIILGCLAAGLVYRALAGALQGLPWALSGLFPVVGAILAHTLLQRSLIIVWLALLGNPVRSLTGSAHDNLIELATLCLGGLVSLALVYQPWLAILVVAPMVTLQRGALVRDLEAAATTDAKTGLLNAVAWEHLAERELARAVRERYGVGVLIIDIDRFKRVNDRYGHLVGDHVLRGIGRCIAAEVREYDGVGRFGGEEFVAILPEITEIEAVVVAERIRSRANELRVSGIVDGIAPADDDLLSVSIGVCCSPDGRLEVTDLLRDADAALYRAKATGRNRVVVAGAPGETTEPAAVA